MRLPFMRYNIVQKWTKQHGFSAGDDCNYFFERDDFQIRVSWRGYFRCTFSRNCEHDVASPRCHNFPCEHEISIMRILSDILFTVERTICGDFST